MDNMIDLINNIENDQSVIINDKVFNKKLLDELIENIDASKEIFPDYECQMLIQMYAVHKGKVKEHPLDSSAIVKTFVTGFGVGVLIAGIIAMVEQYFFSR